MEELIQYIRKHFKTEEMEARLHTFKNRTGQFEAWFKGELLTLFGKLQGQGIIQGFCKEVSVDNRKGQRPKIDIILSIGKTKHFIELKHWFIGNQKKMYWHENNCREGNQQPWHATRFFKDKSAGIYKDVNKLNDFFPDKNRWVLIFNTKNPGIEDWVKGVQAFNSKFYDNRAVITSVTNPADYPDYYFCGLLRVNNFIRCKVLKT